MSKYVPSFYTRISRENGKAERAYPSTSEPSFLLYGASSLNYFCGIAMKQETLLWQARWWSSRKRKEGHVSKDSSIKLARLCAGAAQ